MTDAPALRESADPLERAAVRRGWADVHLVEDLREAPARRLLSQRWESERARAREWFVSPPAGPLLGDYRSMYESPANITRFRRTLDFVTAGDSVFEIGTGKGFLATLLLRDGEVGAYRGGELLPDFVTASREMLEVNGYADRTEVRQLDLYTLAPGDLGDVDLVVCCEVIEHLPDPAGALKVIADALPDGADLLFSTPLLGRLEGIWGHTAIFGVERLRSMIAEAGLVTHHVEPLDNTWVLALVSRGTAASPRAAAAAAGVLDQTAGLERDPLRARSVTNVEPASMPEVKSGWNKRMDLTREHPAIQDDDHGEIAGIRITGTPRPNREGSQYVGLTFPVPDEGRPVLGARLQLHLPHPEQVERIYIEFRDATEAVARWSWRPGEISPKDPRPTFVLRPGTKGLYFTPAPLTGDIRDAERVDVYAAVAKGADVDLTLVRWAWVH